MLKIRLAAIGFIALATPAVAQVGPGDTEVVARAALSALGVATLPGNGANTVGILGASGQSTEFISTQLGGGFVPNTKWPLHVEGYVAYQSYSPIFVLPAPDPTLIGVRWSSVAFTGGVGRNFDLTDGLVLRPSALLSLGHVFGREIFGDLLPVGSAADPQGDLDNGLFAAGVGASLAIEYNRRFDFGSLDVRARQSWMSLRPIRRPSLGSVRSIAHATNVFGRFTRPIQRSAGNSPQLSSVWEASYTHYWGDQAIILRTDWLATLGTGVQIGVSDIAPFGVSAGRVTLRYVIGENYDGVSLGLSMEF